MNQSKKLELSKETLRCLDDQDLTGVAGGGGWGGGGGRGGGHNSNNCNNDSDVCSRSLHQFRVPEPRALLHQPSRTPDSVNRHRRSADDPPAGTVIGPADACACCTRQRCPSLTEGAGAKCRVPCCLVRSETALCASHGTLAGTLCPAPVPGHRDASLAAGSAGPSRLLRSARPDTLRPAGDRRRPHPPGGGS